MKRNTIISTLVIALVALAMLGCPVTDLDVTAPTVVTTVPAASAENVALNATVSATFSEDMAPATIIAANFTLMAGASAIAGVVTYDDLIATFTPDANLSSNTEYTATITIGAKDIAGNALAADAVWSFTTGTIVDSTPPTVASTVPADAASNVAQDASVSATFSEAMNPATIIAANFTLMADATAVVGVVSYDNLVATFNPNADLASDTEYTATITTGVKDSVGNALAVNKIWRFTTSSAPTVVSTLPVNAGFLNVDDYIEATFSEAMDPATITDVTFTVVVNATSAEVSGLVSNESTTLARFTPAVEFTPNTVYKATITTAVEDAAGNPLAVDKVWTFTSRPANPLAPTLGELEWIAIYAHAGVTTDVSGTTTITGGKMMTKLARDSFTGFTPVVGQPGRYTELDGLSYAYDDVDVPLYGTYATTAAYIDAVEIDLGVAYTYMGAFTSGAPTQTITVTELGGLTYTRGVYYTDTAITIETGGGLTLDAQGDPESVWLFVFDGSLTTDTLANGKIVLTNGAQAKNVYWRPMAGATLKAGSDFYGTIFAAPAVALGVGAKVTGRLFSNTAAVTLLSNTITVDP